MAACSHTNRRQNAYKSSGCRCSLAACTAVLKGYQAEACRGVAQLNSHPAHVACWHAVTSLFCHACAGCHGMSVYACKHMLIICRRSQAHASTQACKHTTTASQSKQDVNSRKSKTSIAPGRAATFHASHRTAHKKTCQCKLTS